MANGTLIEPIYDIVKWTLFASKVEDARLISLMIVVDAESGKSYTLDYFKDITSVRFYTDFTAYGLIKLGGVDAIASGVTQIIIPDFNTVISRKESTVRSTVSLLNYLIWDGLHNIETYAIPKIDQKHIGLKCGLIASVTKDVFDRCTYIKSSGFLSRFLMVSYTLNNELKNKIKTVIAENKGFQIIKPIKLPIQKVKVIFPSNNKEFMKEFWKLEKRLSSYNPTGFRMTGILRVILQGVALSHDKRTVTIKHLEEFVAVSKYCNTNANLYPEDYSEGFK